MLQEVHMLGIEQQKKPKGRGIGGNWRVAPYTGPLNEIGYDESRPPALYHTTSCFWGSCGGSLTSVGESAGKTYISGYVTGVEGDGLCFNLGNAGVGFLLDSSGFNPSIYYSIVINNVFLKYELSEYRQICDFVQEQTFSPNDTFNREGDNGASCSCPGSASNSALYPCEFNDKVSSIPTTDPFGTYNAVSGLICSEYSVNNFATGCIITEHEMTETFVKPYSSCVGRRLVRIKPEPIPVVEYSVQSCQMINVGFPPVLTLTCGSMNFTQSGYSKTTSSLGSLADTGSDITASIAYSDVNYIADNYVISANPEWSDPNEIYLIDPEYMNAPEELDTNKVGFIEVDPGTGKLIYNHADIAQKLKETTGVSKCRPQKFEIESTLPNLNGLFVPSNKIIGLLDITNIWLDGDNNHLFLRVPMTVNFDISINSVYQVLGNVSITAPTLTRFTCGPSDNEKGFDCTFIFMNAGPLGQVRVYDGNNGESMFVTTLQPLTTPQSLTYHIDYTYARGKALNCCVTDILNSTFPSCYSSMVTERTDDPSLGNGNSTVDDPENNVDQPHTNGISTGGILSWWVILLTTIASIIAFIVIVYIFILCLPCFKCCYKKLRKQVKGMANHMDEVNSEDVEAQPMKPRKLIPIKQSDKRVSRTLK
jgi:hypothetical protein